MIHDTIETNTEDKEESIISKDTENKAMIAYQEKLDSLPKGLYSKELACGDRLAVSRASY